MLKRSFSLYPSKHIINKRIKVLCVVGARPNFIKIAPLFNEFKKNKKIKPILVHTGQHYDFEMSQIFFQELKIPKPDYNLNVGSGSHAWQTAKVIEKLESVILKEKPNLVIVVGDVNSTLAGALVAAKLHIPIAHIEAGLRSFDKTMPEEINRVLTDHISDFLFCPTKTAVENLKKEGIKKRIYDVGDVMQDVLVSSIAKIGKSKLLKKLRLKPKQYLLLTIHRASNSDNLDSLRKILEAIEESGEKVILPAHPRIRKQFKKLKIRKFKNIKIIDPVSYFNMLVLEKNAKRIVTDSGGVQKEAYWLGIPCVTLRKETEWVETVQSGHNILVGTNKKKIIKAIKEFNFRQKQRNYFSNKNTVRKIIKILMK
ncbi:MAG: UDP-N-acetylglucosamine 2-epimerase (non-hydrolyzing) [Candidatus Paceibacterota bacterium]|jgi:UDP-N-acetylglucosamine 2-epimerase